MILRIFLTRRLASIETVCPGRAKTHNIKLDRLLVCQVCCVSSTCALTFFISSLSVEARND